MPRLLAILPSLTFERCTYTSTTPSPVMSGVASTERENGPPSINTRSRNTTRLRRSLWSDMQVTWSAMKEDTKMDVDDSALEMCADDFVCVDGHNDVVLRFWFPIPSNLASHTDNLVVQYRARGREHSWLSFGYTREEQVVVLKHVRLHGCFEPIHWGRWGGEWSLDDADNLLRVELVVRKFWAWPVERVDLDGWITPRAMVRRLLNGEEKVVESRLCTIIVMTEEKEDLEYVRVLEELLKAIGGRKSKEEVKAQLLTVFANSAQDLTAHLINVDVLYERFLPAQPQLEQATLSVVTVRPNDMPSFRLAQPSRMVVFVSHGSLQGLLYGNMTTPVPGVEWVSNYAMERVLERMITNTGDAPPVEVAVFTACHLADKDSWWRLSSRHPELRLLCYDSTVLRTVGHPMMITVSLMLWYSGDNENIAPIIQWSNANGYASPIHGIWKHSFLSGKPPLANEEHAWIFNPDGILANMSIYNHMFLTDKYKDASPKARYDFLTRDVGPMQVINVTQTTVDNPWSTPRFYTPSPQRSFPASTHQPYSFSASASYGSTESEALLASAMSSTSFPYSIHLSSSAPAMSPDWSSSLSLAHRHPSWPSSRRPAYGEWNRVDITAVASWAPSPMHALRGYAPW